MKFCKRKIVAVLLALVFSLVWLVGCAPSVPPLSDEGDMSPPPSVQTPPSVELEPPEDLGEEEKEPPVQSDDNENDDNGNNANQDGADNNGSNQDDVKDDADDKKEETAFVGLSVHYLDVGQGDCILICLPDNKSVMIDCGNGSASSVNVIKNALKVKNVTTLDCLILTHPDLDHIGSVKDALKEVDVKTVYHPDVSEQKSGFDNYFDAMEFLKAKGAQTKISIQGRCIFNEEYKIAILAPKQRLQTDSCYREFHLAEEPTDSQINNLSPYIYLEYKGYRFLFTGDADKSAEEKLLNYYDSGLLKSLFVKNDIELDLSNIDFLKVSHHGSDGASSENFLNLLQPKYAIISVGGDNVYGHPSTGVQKRLVGANDAVDILRTDVKGTVSVFINNKGVMAVTTQSK